MSRKHWSYQHRLHRAALMATVSPSSRCWRCGKLLKEHPRHKNGRPATWHAGHVPGRLLPALEASVCNLKDGGQRGHEITFGYRAETPSPNA